jgi:hypothetical protein
MATTSDVMARRIGRIVFGAMLLVGVGYLVVALCSGDFGRRWTHHGPGGLHDFHQRLDAAEIIGLTWLAAILAGFVAWRIALRRRFSGDPEALFARSLMVPAAGISLILPLTLHLPVVLTLTDHASFDTWVAVSMCITGLAHLVLAVASAVRGYQLVMGKPAWTPRGIYVATVVTSCLPFIILYAIPPILVAITALPFLPLLRAMDRLVVRERAQLASAPQVLPRAVARLAAAA